jgi:hypothetical protein
MSTLCDHSKGGPDSGTRFWDPVSEEIDFQYKYVGPAYLEGFSKDAGRVGGDGD